MAAAVLSSPRRMDVVKVPRPEPGRGLVRIRLEGCGVCGSNLSPWEGRPWFQYPFGPGEPGHEGWGWVDEVGDDVVFRPGQRVAFLSNRSYAEFESVPQESVVAVPPELDDMPFPGEPLGCAMNIFERADIQPGQTVAIVGIGFIGALLIQLAKKRGARVLAISRRPFALDLARRLGADETFPFDEDFSPVVNRIRDWTHGKGCERVIEVVGRQQALDLATELTCEMGRLVIAGYHQDGLRQVNLQVWNWRGLDVINAHERDPVRYLGGMRRAMEAIGRGDLDPAPLYTHQFRLDEISGAFQHMEERPDAFLKGLVCFG